MNPWWQDERARPGFGVSLRVLVSILSVILTAACGPLEPGPALSSAAATGPESRGTEFILAFHPSLEASADRLTVQLHLTSDVETDVTVEYPVRTPTFVETVSVVPGEITIVELPTDASFDWTSDGVADNAVRATGSAPFTVYMVNTMRQSSDAALGLPVNALNTRYVALDWSVRDGAQLSVTAIYDDTDVTLTPSSDWPGHPVGVPFSVTLDRGEGYFIRLPRPAAADSEGFSGTQIEATRPVQVTNGNGCVNIPWPYNACDHVFEVAQPVQTWGQTVPVVNPSDQPGSFYRVVAANDGTRVDLDGVPLGTLDGGRFLQTAGLYGGHVFEADGPIFVAQFLPSQEAPISNGQGDPSMGNMVPAEQYLERYTFSTVGDEWFAQHGLTVIAHDEETDTLLLDGVPIGADAFTPIPGTGLSTATVPLAEGTHTTFSRLGHGINVYGFNNYDSYLYPGGARFETIQSVGDVDPPICGASLDPDDAAAVVGSGLDVGSGVFSVALEEGAANLNLTVASFRPGDTEVSYRVTRSAPAIGGRGLVTIRDGSGNLCQQEIDLALEGSGVCLGDLTARSTIAAAQLTWTSDAGADLYTISRGASAAGPFVAIGETTSAYATYLDETAPLDSLQYYRVERVPGDGAAPCVSAPVAAWIPATSTRMTAVPDLIGRPESEAGAALSASGLASGPVASASSAQPAGLVTEQDPPVGSFVPLGLAVSLAVSTGPSDVVVPSVVGQTELGAELLLSSVDLVVGAISIQTTDALPPGRVLQQIPAAGATATSGAAVALVVAAALEPVSVPNVVGQQEAVAASTLAGVGLVVGVSVPAPHYQAPAGEVIGQTPFAGSILDPGAAVDLVVSTGPATTNGAPSFAPTPILVGVTRDRPFQFMLRASDPDGDPLTFSLGTAPPGMTIDPLTGVIEWLPGTDRLGERQVVDARATDPDGAAGAAYFNVLVQNYRPYFLSSPPDRAVRGETLLYQSVARDPDGDAPVFSLDAGAPDGMTVDPDSGLLTWEPASDQVGGFYFSLRVADPFDPNGLGSVQSISVSVPNAAPVFESTPPAEAIRGELYSYTPTVSDADGDPFDFSIVSTPVDGLLLDPISGRIDWVPDRHQVGDFDVYLQVSDPFGAASQQTIRINVPNATPVLTSTPITEAVRDTLYTYDVEATDADGDPITFALGYGPAGMTIDPVTGVVRWTPGPTQEGFNSVSIRASDVSGATGFQNFAIDVPAVNDPPRITSVPPDRVDEDAAYTYAVTAEDPESDPLTFVLTAAPTGMTIDAGTGLISWAPGQTDVGANLVAVRVSDPSGRFDLQQYVLQVRDLDPDPDAPVVSLLAPTEDAELRMPADVVANVDDTNLARWVLELWPGGATAGSVLAEGFAPVIAETIGLVDTTLLENGLYSLRLTAEDAAGNVTVAEQTVLVAGTFKPGAFTLRFVDLSVSIGDLPVRIEREYDSRRRNLDDDLGFGWRFVVTSDARYTHNRTPGLDWLVSSSGGFPDIPCYVANETRSHYTEIRFSETEFYRFGFRVQMFGLGSATLDGCIGIASFEQIGGIPGATLEILGTTDVLYQLEEILDFDPFSDDFLNPYRAPNVRLTTADGREFDLNIDQGVTRIQDANDNALFIQPAGVVHDSGVQVEFVRDAQGRVQRVVDPSGYSIQYSYDAAGDLVSVIAPDGGESRFGYDAGHLLLDHSDPVGRQPLRNEYNATGRLVAQIDGDGFRRSIDTDLATRTASVTDALGATSTTVSDADGNLAEVGLADGGVVRFTHDARGNVLTETDPLGQTRSFTWDAADRLTSETDALGETTAYGWRLDGRLESITGPAGDGVAFAYDTTGNLLESRDATGSVLQSMTYDTRGLATTIETLGGLTQNTFDAFGRLQQQVLPSGGQRFVDHNPSGQVMQNRLYRTDGDGRLTVDGTRFSYDPAGRLISETDPLGAVTRYAYDAAGRLRSRTDARGYRTTFEYDGRGHVTRIDHADGSVERFVYDAAGRRTAATDQVGRTTFYTYDELGRLLETQYADGSRVSHEYDGADRRVSTTNELGAVTRFERDAAGRVVRRIGADGAVTSFEYDANGTRTAMIDALGRRTTFVNDQAAFLAPRLSRTVFPDGAETRLDHAPSGGLASRTDETGRATSLVYDAAGRLESVTDAAGATTRYGYDEVGNRVTETDALGRVTWLGYDGNRRLLSRRLPGGEVESFQYDVVGNLIAKTSFSGAITYFGYDAMNRLERKDLPDGRVVLYGHTQNGLLETVEDARGITRYVYDVRDRLIEIQEPDGQSISHEYDAAGRLTSITAASGTTRYTYDAVGRMTQVTDPSGRTTLYAYDLAGNPTLVTRANGTSTEYQYDTRDRVVSVRHLGPGGAPELAVFDYDFDAAGRRTRVDESSGRSLEFAYDDGERLVEERETLAPDLFVTRYDYDAAGQRIRVDRDGAITDYSYDNNGQMLSAGTIALGWDIDGRLISRDDDGAVMSYAWDAEDRLVEVVAPDGFSTRFGYDAAGRRFERDAEGAVTRFLVDPVMPGGYAQAIAEFDGSGSLLARHTFGLGRIGLQRGTDERTIHSDALGSVRLLTDDFGSATDFYAYDAFGQVLDVAGATENEALFRGELFDTALGMYDLRARWMSPEFGLFASRDPVAGNPFEPRSLARYPYAYSDPVNKLDPSGGFTLFELGTSFSVRNLLGTSVLVSFGVASTIEFGMVEYLRGQLLGQPLNQKAGRAQLGSFRVAAPSHGVAGGGGNVELQDTVEAGFDLGGGAVESAFKLSGGLTGTTDVGTASVADGVSITAKVPSAFSVLNEVYAKHAGLWMSDLPSATTVHYDQAEGSFTVTQIPANYHSCGFNQYIYRAYDLQLMKSLIGPGAKQLDLAAKIVGAWLAYVNLAVLQNETATDMAIPDISLLQTGGGCSAN